MHGGDRGSWGNSGGRFLRRKLLRLSPGVSVSRGGMAHASFSRLAESSLFPAGLPRARKAHTPQAGSLSAPLTPENARNAKPTTSTLKRCWNHRITTVLAALPKQYQAEARTLLCAMPYAETQAACETLRAQSNNRYHKVAPKAGERLANDWERLVTFYQFPHEHWVHLRTTTIVESPFATGRLRTTAAQRFK